VLDYLENIFCNELKILPNFEYHLYVDTIKMCYCVKQFDQRDKRHCCFCYPNR
jgi:hypothetical protein